ncbi:hypothetical protein [Coralloluteibacterium thermophilus]|uniref:Peptidase C58 YopT-type domain-containing protein n=1 Tax=Coralloluteibacterium thermophilum TaxID=2707049 RepID=A0ABV9NN04_9GAMM
MPIDNAYKSGNTLFSRASSECIIRGKNNNPGVDADTDNVDGGICSGITSAWIVSLLNANKVPECRDTAKFAGHFDVLRFHGAYFKELHGTSEVHLEKLSGALVVNGVKAGKVQGRPFTLDQMPEAGWWAGYVSMKGHAIAVGKFEGFHHIMEPNFGLFTYRTGANFIEDLNQEIETYMGMRGKQGDATIYLYRRASGGTVS